MKLQVSLRTLILAFIIGSSLLGVVVPAFGRHRNSVKLTSTKDKMYWLRSSMEHYRGEYKSYPGFDPGTDTTDPSNRLNTSIAPKGVERRQVAVNERLKEFIRSWHRRVSEPPVNPDYWARDGWDNPIIVRILRVPEAQSDGSVKIVESYYLWSYGPDGINGVDATPNYTNRGTPDYDKEEFERIEKSLKDCGDDIAITDR